MGGKELADTRLRTPETAVSSAIKTERPSPASSGPRRRTAWGMRQVPRPFPYGRRYGPGAARKLVGPLAAGSPGLRLVLALEIERHCSADEILQGLLVDLVAFVDVDGAPDIPFEAGVE